jgi:hypothetical protein
VTFPRLGREVDQDALQVDLAGISQGDSAYAYFRILDVEIPVRKGMKIGYWIYHAQGTPKIALDGHFTDGNTFRDFNNRYSHAIGKVIVVSARSLSIEIDEHETIEGHGGHVGWD